MSISRPKFLLLGDSLTQLSWDGWGGQLAHVYQRRVDILNRGMSGYNTAWYLDYVVHNRDDVLVDNVQLVTIFFGANDASHAQHNPHHHVPLDEFRVNLKQLVTLCRLKYGSAIPIVLLTPPPVQHEQRLEFQKQRYPGKATGILERNLDLSGRYADATQQVATELTVPCVNLWKHMQQDDKWERFFYDGLHFTQEGNAVVAQAVLEAIREHYPQLYVTPDPITNQWCNSASSCPSLAQSGPYHDEIVHTDPRKAFQEHYYVKK